jgi:type IV secretion system protein VirD4
MTTRAAGNLPRLALRTFIQLWPLWLFWFAWTLAGALWRELLLALPDRSTAAYAFAYRAWLSVALLGPITLMAVAIAAYRLRATNRIMPLAGIAGVVLATALTTWPELQRLAPYVGRAPLLNLLGALDLGILQAVAVGVVAVVIGAGCMVQRTIGTRFSPRVVRGRSGNFGHADWLSIRDARHLFPGPDETYGGIVVGEAYRVDQDRVARRAFDPSDRSS